MQATTRASPIAVRMWWAALSGHRDRGFGQDQVRALGRPDGERPLTSASQIATSRTVALAGAPPDRPIVTDFPAILTCRPVMLRNSSHHGRLVNSFRLPLGKATRRARIRSAPLRFAKRRVRPHGRPPTASIGRMATSVAPHTSERDTSQLSPVPSIQCSSVRILTINPSGAEGPASLDNPLRASPTARQGRPDPLNDLRNRGQLASGARTVFCPTVTIDGSDCCSVVTTESFLARIARTALGLRGRLA